MSVGNLFILLIWRVLGLGTGFVLGVLVALLVGWCLWFAHWWLVCSLWVVAYCCSIGCCLYIVYA